MTHTQQTRMEFYLSKENEWKQLATGIWAWGGKGALLNIRRLNGPHGYVASSLTNLDSTDSEGFKRHLEGIGAVLDEHGIASIVPHRDTDPEKNADVPARIVFEVDERKVSHSGLVVADFTHPSTGGGIEAEVARHHNIPMIVLMRKNTKISRMILGHPSIITSIEYENYTDAQRKLAKVLQIFMGKPSELRRQTSERIRTQFKPMFEASK